MYVLYVNKQEFSASSWRSNQGYVGLLMHGLEWPPCPKNSPDTFLYAFSLFAYTDTQLS